MVTGGAGATATNGASGARPRRRAADRRSAREATGGQPRTAHRTRQRILTAALSLFNEQGTAAVSTNHIAAAARLSPGNLYYWFANKQEIVRALVEQWLAESEQYWEDAHELPAHVHALWDDMSRSAEVNRRYRFAVREIPALMREDPELAASYRATYRRRLSAQVSYARRLVMVGVLRPPAPPRTLEDLVVVIWLVAENWAAHQDVMRDPKQDGPPSSGIRPLLAVIGPYLTDQGQHAFEAL